MVHSKAADRYARSLFQLAAERGNTERILQDIVLYRDTLTREDQLSAVMRSPIISGSRKQAIMEGLFGSRFDSLTSAFFRLVIAKGRESVLHLMAEAYIHEDKKSKGIQEGILLTAAPLTPELRQKLQQKAEKMAGGNVILKEKTDPSLIGGFVLKVGDLQYDASSRTQFEKLRHELLDTSYIPKIDLI
jgi:F-type H+-transporting ATPase subunit delta